jgi:two-component system sensor histidine kinase BaeS
MPPPPDPRWAHGRPDRRGYAEWRRAPGRRPPWWPDNEPWPPANAAAWRQLRRGFMRRAGCFAVFVVIGLALLIGAISGYLLTVAQAAYVLIGALLLIVVFALVVGRLFGAFRRSAQPVADLIEATGRVETGELDVQVPVPAHAIREVRALTGAFNAMSARLSATERERRRLLAEISHELRTPLTVIQGNVEAMIDGVYPTDREHLERIQAETHQLARLIEDLRTLSLAETGQLRLVREPIDLADLARDVAAGFEAEATGAGVTVEVNAPDDMPELELDPFRLRQVIANLVSNALRHTPPGGRVTISAAPAAGGAVLSVADTGAGMTPEAVEHAFERFWRAGQSAGAGLGLAIVRDLVTAHGGTVSIESSVGVGTTVTLRLSRPEPTTV